MPTQTPSIDDLVTEHGARIYGLCARLDPDPDDAWQSVWERALTRLGAFDPARGTLGAWLSTLTHRLLIDRHRTRMRRPEGHAVPAEGFEPRLVADPAPALDARRQLERALARLPEERRRVIVMHHVGGHSVEQIAAVEGIAPGTVKSRLHRGRAQLAALMREEEP